MGSFSTGQLSAVGHEAELTPLGKSFIHSILITHQLVPGTTEWVGGHICKQNGFCLHGT